MNISKKNNNVLGSILYSYFQMVLYHLCHQTCSGEEKREKLDKLPKGNLEKNDHYKNKKILPAS